MLEFLNFQCDNKIMITFMLYVAFGCLSSPARYKNSSRPHHMQGMTGASEMQLHFSLCTIRANIVSQKADAPQSKMPLSVVWVVFLPNNFLFTTDYQIQHDMGATLAVLQTETSQSP